MLFVVCIDTLFYDILDFRIIFICDISPSHIPLHLDLPHGSISSGKYKLGPAFLYFPTAKEVIYRGQVAETR
jgi:hypothetical protein